MDARRLVLLLTLERRGTVTAAAHALHLTPTAVSQQLKLLEREAGQALLRRVGRGVELTDAGRVLAEAARHLEVAAAEVEARWADYRGEVAGTVRISLFPTAAQLLLPGLVRRLTTAPGVALEVVESDLHGDDYPARTDEVDLVVAHRAGVEGPWPGEQLHDRGITVLDLTEEPLDVALAPDHRLAGRRRLTVADVAEERWIGVPEDWPFDRELVAWFAEADRAPRHDLRLADLRTQEALVAAGHGVALLPRHAAGTRDGARLALVPTGPTQRRRRIGALARADRAARVAVRHVLAELRTEARSLTSRAPRRPPAP